MEKETKQEPPILKLPLIGKIEKIECLDALNKRVEFPASGTQTEKHYLAEKIQKSLGDYLWDSEQYLHIIDLLFPRAVDINVEEIVHFYFKERLWRNNKTFPLFTWVFAKDDVKEDMPLDLSAAWSALMLELGEFYLGECFSHLPKEIVKSFLPYLYSHAEKPDEHNVLYALFTSHPDLVKNIWERIAGDDILLVFIDDKETFDDRWGLSGLVDKVKRSESTGMEFEGYNIKTNKIWVNPVANASGGSNTRGYSNEVTKEEIDKILQSKLADDSKNLLPVLVVDLLFNDNEGINKIEGDNLIEELRNELDINPLIIGFTGGRSPFVINSAVKAGADIVIMKERGDIVGIPGSHGSGSSGGLFDLLWALSKNISRWRFLEKYKELLPKKLEEDKDFYISVLKKLFFSIENESPFWRRYLRDWQRDIENIRLEAIFKSVSHE
jgi:hypothetical protein